MLPVRDIEWGASAVITEAWSRPQQFAPNYLAYPPMIARDGFDKNTGRTMIATGSRLTAYFIVISCSSGQ